MRLYLSSYRLGDQADHLQKWIGHGGRVRLIANGLDGASPETRRKVYRRSEHELVELGFEVRELDLRSYFLPSHDLRDELEEVDLIWAAGGNAFTLSTAMKYSGFASVLYELLRGDALVYGGYSAGAVVAGPRLDGIEVVDSPDPEEALPSPYPSEVSWEALGLVDYLIVPHFRSDHWEAERIEAAVRLCQERGIDHRPLRDGEVIIVEGGELVERAR